MNAQLDYAAWPHPLHDHQGWEDVVDGGLRDGIHRVWVGDGSVDLLLERCADTPRRTRDLLVVFGGAVSARDGKRGPFFSGASLARSVGLPLLAISDPSLVRGPTALGWYAGHEAAPHLTRLLAQLLNRVARHTGCRLLLVGFSGGGFAMLSVLGQLDREAVGLAWNPQTSISEFTLRPVSAYLKAAFPALHDASIDDAALDERERRARARRCLERAGVVHDVTDLELPPTSSLLYLQNRSDWHVAKHAAPFVRTRRWQRLGPRSFASRDGRAACWFGAWGEGHAVPPYQLVKDVLARASRGSTVAELAAALDREQPDAEAPIACVHVASAHGAIAKLQVSARVNGGVVRATCRFDAPAEVSIEGCEYAFYLRRHGQRVATRWYAAAASVDFERPDGDAEALEVIGFVRDGLGNTLSASAAVVAAAVEA